MIPLAEIVTEGKKARSKPPTILGGCDYIIDEFKSQLTQYPTVSKEDISRYPVIVQDSAGNQYSDGHTIAKVNGSILSGITTNVAYIDLSLDQFCDTHKSKFEVSFGKQSQIPGVIILNADMYDIYNDKDRSTIYT